MMLELSQHLSIEFWCWANNAVG